MGGCATGYKPKGFSGGYADAYLQDNMFRVSFEGNGYTSPQRVADLALMRAADVALQNGYRYFIIIDNQADTKNVMVAIPSGQATGVSKPIMTYTIACHADRPTSGQGVIYDAKQVMVNVGASYGV